MSGLLPANWVTRSPFLWIPHNVRIHLLDIISWSLQTFPTSQSRSQCKIAPFSSTCYMVSILSTAAADSSHCVYSTVVEAPCQIKAEHGLSKNIWSRSERKPSREFQVLNHSALYTYYSSHLNFQPTRSEVCSCCGNERWSRLSQAFSNPQMELLGQQLRLYCEFSLRTRSSNNGS